MGALAPVSPWIPEDDILLKNAVEAGASLESLAKGAVHFSRRFTVRELQDRWYSLLYDPVISVEASASMIEFERSASRLPSKFSRLGNSKDNKCPGKRKSESVRSCYYALRKRICNAPFNSIDLSFLVGPSDNNYIGNTAAPPPGDGVPSHLIVHDFGLQQPASDAMNYNFSRSSMDCCVNDHAIHSGLQDQVEGDLPMDYDNEQGSMPQILEDNLHLPETISGVEVGQQDGLPVHSVLEAGDLGIQPSPTFDAIDDGEIHGNICSGMKVNEVINSPISDCGTSFHSLEYSSPLPGMSIWRTLSAPVLPVDIDIREKDHHIRDAFELPDDNDIQNAEKLEFFINSDSKLEVEEPRDHLKIPDSSNEGFLAELSNSLLNFTNEDELFLMNADGKEVIDKSYYDGLSSLLLSSPNDANQDQLPCTSRTEESRVPESLLSDPAGVQDNESPYGDGGMISDSEVGVLKSAQALTTQAFKLGSGPMYCVLNTEDPEIPSNDDVFLPVSTFPSVDHGFQEFTDNKFSYLSHENAGKSLSLLPWERKNLGEPHGPSQRMGLHTLPKKGVTHPNSECGLQVELPNSDSSHSKLANASADVLPPALKEERKEISLANNQCHNLHDSLIDFDAFRSYTPENAGGIKKDPDTLMIARDHQSLYAAVGSVGIDTDEHLTNAPASDPEGLPAESEDDIPYFSDIEAMILDMDLDPDDQDLYMSEEVSRYQHESTKRAIIRLEQGAYAYMQRAIASHGAYAILYGRRSKHYIRKPEVLVGRATEDVGVDIDLAKEGRANKISRRQAIIKMDQSGSFHLKNIGKCSILVNDKEVTPGHSFGLSPGCLIEIRDMPFIFETNPDRVKEYLVGVGKKSQNHGSRFS